jgi:hypothetical protein
MSQWINVHALWQILVAALRCAALICGAGLPAVFACGLRALSLPAKGKPVAADTDRLVAGNALGVAVAALCFALVVAGVVWGIYFIVSGG